MSKPKILVIDDDKDYLELIDEALEEQFVVSCVHSIQAADTLVNEDKVSKYDIYESPIRNVIFNAGETSRINVGHFMTDLITNENTWNKWKGQMPVIYNKEEVEENILFSS